MNYALKGKIRRTSFLKILNVKEIFKVKNIKKICLNKRLLAIMLLIITLISTVQPVFAISGSGSATWTGGQYDSGIRTTESSSNCRYFNKKIN
jgi:hypothetical protein